MLEYARSISCHSGGMVDAGDLKSPALQQAYGFESRLW